MALAIAAHDVLASTGVQVLPSILPLRRESVLPLSFAQQRLWFLAQMDGVGTTYHIPMALHVRGLLDTAALRRTLDALLARHEALRSVFVAIDGQPQVVLLPASTRAPFIEHDLQRQPQARQQSEQLCTEEVQAPFDLSHGPLMRARLIHVGAQEHIFLLTFHHIVFDGWSVGVLTRELSALYTAFAHHQPDPLPPLAIQYPDYASWQRHWLVGERFVTQATYWRQTLADAPVRLELPTDRPRPSRQSYDGAFAPVQLDVTLTHSLKRLSQQQGTTLFMTLMAAWAAVLSRLSGQQDLVIGTPTANRHRQEVEPLIGFFVNTLALRIDLSGTPSVAELLTRVRQAALMAHEHQDLPFEQVVDIVQPPRHLDHAPLFQVMFVWQSNDEGTFKLPHLQVESTLLPLDTVKFDLELDLREVDGRIVGMLGYATALFDATTIERYRNYLVAMLQAMAVDANQPVARIDVLGSGERTLLLETWNRTETSCPGDLCIHQLFEQQVAKTPNAVAGAHEEQSLTYAQLNAQANRLAHHLIERGVQPDDRVAICVERSAAMVVSLLGILKAGGAYVPLDPTYPSDRLAQILHDAQPRLLLEDAAGRRALGEQAGDPLQLVDLDKPSNWMHPSDSNPDPQALGLTPAHLAYVIYTSGSTGTPKGVMVEHVNTINLLQWSGSTFSDEELSRTLFSTSMNFDLSVYECFAPLTRGAALCLVDNALSLIHARHDVSIINTVPSSINHLFSAKAIPPSVQTINLAGEPLKPSLIADIFSNTETTRVCNLYGPSETTTYSTMMQVHRGNVITESIGRPIANTRIYLLDAYGQPVPLGAVGEIYIGGAGVARGYLNRPELTAERFLADPFSPHPEARMYRTGDLARYRPDGNLEFLGRNDHQVKIRGFRIEPGEIEARLAEHPAVREAVVLAREDVPGDKRLVAYITTAADSPLAADALAAALRAHLGNRLPDYMVPAAFVTLDTLPLTPNGKLDRKALPAPDGEAYARRVYEAPQGEIEQALAQLWTELLGVERISRHDNFFELGGHSLLAVRLLSRLPTKLGVSLSLQTLFAQSSLMALAIAAHDVLASTGVQVLPSILPLRRAWKENKVLS